MEYRVVLPRRFGDPQHSPQQFELVIWCFKNFRPYKQVDGSLQVDGCSPLGLRTDIAPRITEGALQPAWDRLRPMILELSDFLRELDSCAPLSHVLRNNAEAAYGLVALSLNYVQEKMAQHAAASRLVSGMVRVIGIIETKVHERQVNVQRAMSDGYAAVESAAVWPLRHGESLCLDSDDFSRLESELYVHIKRVSTAEGQLVAHSVSLVVGTQVDERLECLQIRFPVAPGSTLRTGKYIKLGDPGCLPTTRTSTLNELYRWFCDAKAPNFLLLEGGTGSGKTSVAEQHVSNYASPNHVLGTFRFDRGAFDEEDRDVKSLAYALAHFFLDIPSARELLEQRASEIDGLEPLDLVSRHA